MYLKLSLVFIKHICVSYGVRKVIKLHQGGMRNVFHVHKDAISLVFQLIFLHKQCHQLCVMLFDLLTEIIEYHLHITLWISTALIFTHL